MKKLLKSEICESVNSVWDPHVAENWLKSQTFRLKKKKVAPWMWHQEIQFYSQKKKKYKYKEYKNGKWIK